MRSPPPAAGLTAATGAGVPGCGDACDGCLTRTWLLGRLAGHLDRVRSRIDEVLALPDDALIAAVGGGEAEALRAELASVVVADGRGGNAAASVRTICRCSPRYPARLRDLPAPPAVLHLAGSGALPGMGATEHSPGEQPERSDPVVAIVGARSAGPYGLGVAHDLARGLAAAGVTIVSGLALGADSAAHDGTLAGGGRTIAVLPAAPQRPYPASKRALHRRILATGLAVSELGPGVAPRRWMFPARNRIIAALADMAIVVAAAERSGAMLTARVAGELGRIIGAVPGPITSSLSRGPHDLLRQGACLVARPEDVLEALLGPHAAPAVAPRPKGLAPDLETLLEAIAEGRAASDAFAAAGLDAARGMAALAALELVGYVRREPGGRYSATV